MNWQVNVDRVIDSWLAEGPSQLPDRSVDRIVQGIEAIDQRGHWWLPRRTEMNRFVLSLAGAAVLVVAVLGAIYYFAPGRTGFGGGNLYSSSRHGYSVTIAKNWTVNQIPGSWPPGSVFDYLGAGSDQFLDPDHPDIDRFMNSQPITNGMSFAQWVTQYKSIHDRWFSNCRPLTEDDVELAGESGLISTADCSGTNDGPADGAMVLIAHNGRAYSFRVLSNGAADETALLLDWLKGLGWVAVAPTP